jgi:hypothetical protein
MLFDVMIVLHTVTIQVVICRLVVWLVRLEVPVLALVVVLVVCIKPKIVALPVFVVTNLSQLNISHQQIQRESIPLLMAVLLWALVCKETV